MGLTTSNPSSPAVQPSTDSKHQLTEEVKVHKSKPHNQYEEARSKETLLLSPTGLAALSHELPTSSQWKIIFTSSTSSSWSTFLQALELAETSVLIIRSVDGVIFGGYRGSPWIRDVNFSDSESFVFKLSPEIQIYRSTGINSNHSYYNHGSKTFPNGIGFGGQLDYFAIYLESLERGHSRGDPSTTFNNPQFTSEPEFQVDRVELWLLEERDQESVGYKRSIRDNIEAKAMLEMAGIQMNT